MSLHLFIKLTLMRRSEWYISDVQKQFQLRNLVKYSVLSKTDTVNIVVKYFESFFFLYQSIHRKYSTLKIKIDKYMNAYRMGYIPKQFGIDR